MKRIILTAVLLIACFSAGAGQTEPFSLGGTVVITSEQLQKYSSADLRNALAGLSPGVEVIENYGGPGVSALEHTGQYGASTKVSVTSRGNSLIYLLDGVQILLDETPLDPAQIESVSIVRDVLGKTMYGATAAGGYVYIKTKRGPSEKGHYINFDAEYGVNMTDRMPGYADARNYALVNNLARDASGLEPLYTRSDVESYKRSDAYDLRYPNTDFKSMLLNGSAPYSRAGISCGGATDNTRYFVSLGYLGEGDVYKVGPVSNYNRIGINANIDVKLHRNIDVSFGFVSSYTIRKSNNYGYGTTCVEEFPAIIEDLVSTPPIEFPVYANNDPELESPWYAVSSKYTQNPYANIMENGSYTETTRKGLLTVDLNVNLDFLAKGLSSRTSGAFDATNLVRLGKSEDYAAYILEPVEDFLGNITMVPQQSASHSVVSVSDKSRLVDYYSNRFFLKEALMFDRSFGRHDLDACADFMITKRSQKFITEHRREIDYDFGLSDVIGGKYILQAAMNVHGTYSLLDVWSVSPSAGAGWVVSEEPWMKGPDYLKLRVQGGLIHYDPMANAGRDIDNYTWGAGGVVFGPYSANQWFGSSKSLAEYRTYVSTLANPNLRLERRYEMNAGFDLRAFRNRFNTEFTFYDSLIDGPVAALSNVIPAMSGVSGATLYMNYARNRRWGFELNAGWKDTAGDFSYAVNAWGATNMSRILRIDEIRYPDAYRSKVGRSLSSIWGLRCIGRYDSDDEAMAADQSFDDVLHAGDLKYQDMNGDGTIDDTDICCIGDSSPKLIFGLNVNLSWKDFDITLVGTGRAFCDVMLSNSYFWNGWGDGNYSNFTLRHISDPSYPTVRYYKVSNNYRASSFWLTDGSYFKIQTLELGYNLPVGRWNWKSMSRFRVFARANNLLTLTGIEDVDPEALSSGISNYPLMKTFVGGLKLSF